MVKKTYCTTILTILLNVCQISGSCKQSVTQPGATKPGAAIEAPFYAPAG